jgi:hypothetical protein
MDILVNKSWSRGILIFIASTLGLGTVLALLMAWLLASDQNITTISFGFLNFQDFKDRSESIAASVGLVLGAAVSLAGSLVAIYLASLASDVQSQQFKLEFMSFIDGEFNTAKGALARYKRALLVLHDFVYLRDDVLHRAIRNGSLNAKTATIADLVLVVECERLQDDMRKSLTELALANLEIRESSLASSLRNTAFEANKPKFIHFFDMLSTSYIAKLQKIDKLNMAISMDIMSFSGAMAPSVTAQRVLDQLKSEKTNAMVESLFSEVKAKITAESIVRDFIASYNVALMKDDCLVFERADYARRNVLVGICSLLGHDEIEILNVNPDFNPKFYIARASSSVAITGIFELAKLYWSTPSDSEIKKVCEEYVKSISPNDTQITNRLNSFVNQKIHEMIEVSRDVIGLEPIIGLQTLPSATILGNPNVDISNPKWIESKNGN